MTSDDTKMSEPMSKEEMIDTLKGLVFGTFDRTTAKEREALDMAIKALEKDIAKEPVQTHKRYGHGNEYNDYYCPECDEFLAYEPQGNRYKYEGGWSRCKNCGQKIIWSESKK